MVSDKQTITTDQSYSTQHICI